MDCLKIKNELIGQISGQVLLSEPMSNHTTWKVGGLADVMVLPSDAADVSEVICYANKQAIPLSIIGNGSNLLVLDKGIRGIVIKINNCLDYIHIQDQLIIAGGGAILPKVARLAISRGLKGLEFAIGIPASVGGATVMNAGAHNSSMSNVIREVKVVNPRGDIETIPVVAFGFQYRSSAFKNKGYVVVETVFQLSSGDTQELTNIVAKNMELRKAKQPLNYPNAGSIFKNPPGLIAGKLIDESGCKEMQVGMAKVSEKHANFIVNTGGARAEDILQLIALVREQVLARFNIALELEVQIIGES